MAVWNQTTIQRLIRELQNKVEGTKVTEFSGVPTGTAREGDIGWDVTTNNLYLFSAAEASYILIAGQNGADAIYVNIETNNGVVLKNNLGSTEATAIVYIGGGRLDTEVEDEYTYLWKYQGSELCVANGNNQVHNNSGGTPEIATGAPLSCPIGFRLATGKSIIVGAEDILSKALFTCDVGNIPD